MQNALLNKLNAVIASIQADNYADALAQLQIDILGKTDGCATSGGLLIRMTGLVTVQTRVRSRHIRVILYTKEPVPYLDAETALGLSLAQILHPRKPERTMRYLPGFGVASIKP